MLHSNFSLHILQLGQVQSLFCQIHTPDLKVYKTLEEDTTFLLEARAETCSATSHTECSHQNYSTTIGPYFGIVTKAVKFATLQFPLDLGYKALIFDLTTNHESGPRFADI